MSELDETTDRDERIRQLESRLAKRSHPGVLPPVAAVALVGALALLLRQRADVSYFFSDRTPLELGAEGGYRFEQLQENRYVQVHGMPTLKGVYALEGEQQKVVVGLRETPLLVVRGVLPTEHWKPGSTPPQPDQRSFTVRGRLVPRADVKKYSDAFPRFEDFGEVKPQWLVVEGERPGTDLGAIAWFGLLAAFAGVNSWLLARGVGRMLELQKNKTPGV